MPFERFVHLHALTSPHPSPLGQKNYLYYRFGFFDKKNSFTSPPFPNPLTTPPPPPPPKKKKKKKKNYRFGFFVNKKVTYTPSPQFFFLLQIWIPYFKKITYPSPPSPPHPLPSKHFPSQIWILYPPLPDSSQKFT